MRTFGLVVVVSLCVGVLARTAAAQSLPTEHRAAVGPGNTQIRLSSSLGKRAQSSLAIGRGKPTRLHEGEAAGALVVGHGKVVVALATDGKREPFVLRVIEGDKVGAAIGVARPGTRADIPYAVVGAATARGFAIFFQEIQSNDPTAAHTYMLELDDAGKPTGAAREVPIPWSLAAAVDNGAGFHLALIYPMDGMRLSMVSTDAKGQPQQHPDWASPRGFLDQVHLVASGAKIRAIYRSNNRIVETDVTRIREWGTEPPKPKVLGAISASQLIALDGAKVVKVAR